MADNPGLRIIFAGTPDFAAEHLRALLNSPHQIIAVYTQPDRPAGRGKNVSPSPVKQLAEQYHLPVYQPPTLKTESAQQELQNLNADIMVVVAYGLLLPQAVLDIPPLGCINVHGSLLPRWRGAAPIQRAVEAGDKETGITIMQMDAGLDTGPMLLKVACVIEDEDTSETLFNKLAELGGPALLTALEQIAKGTIVAESQDDNLATYAKKIDKAEANINWHLSAQVLQHQIRAFNPFPVAYTTLDKQRIKIYAAEVLALENASQPGTIIQHPKHELVVACGEQALSIQQLQLPGKKKMAVADVLRGKADLFKPGTRLSYEG